MRRAVSAVRYGVDGERGGGEDRGRRLARSRDGWWVGVGRGHTTLRPAVDEVWTCAAGKEGGIEVIAKAGARAGARGQDRVVSCDEGGRSRMSGFEWKLWK